MKAIIVDISASNCICKKLDVTECPKTMLDDNRIQSGICIISPKFLQKLYDNDWIIKESCTFSEQKI